MLIFLLYDASNIIDERGNRITVNSNCVMMIIVEFGIVMGFYL